MLGVPGSPGAKFRNLGVGGWGPNFKILFPAMLDFFPTEIRSYAPLFSVQACDIQANLLAARGRARGPTYPIRSQSRGPDFSQFGMGPFHPLIWGLAASGP